MWAQIGFAKVYRVIGRALGAITDWGFPTLKGRAMSLLSPRFPISEQEVELVVHEFYAVVRTHPGLGPIFNKHVTDWTAHEAKIVNFWRNVIFFDKVYDGNPMRAHMHAGDVRPQHFDVWLGLFDSVLRRHLNPLQAAAWSELAHRIGRGLRIGVEERHRNAVNPPRLVG
jgi:hemoglobin